mgnify:CR=1 FL=1
MKKKTLKLKKEVITQLSSYDFLSGGAYDSKAADCSFQSNCICISVNHCRPTEDYYTCGQIPDPTIKPVTLENCPLSDTCVSLNTNCSLIACESNNLCPVG